MEASTSRRPGSAYDCPVDFCVRRPCLSLWLFVCFAYSRHTEYPMAAMLSSTVHMDRNLHACQDSTHSTATITITITISTISTTTITTTQQQQPSRRAHDTCMRDTDLHDRRHIRRNACSAAETPAWSITTLPIPCLSTPAHARKTMSTEANWHREHLVLSPIDVSVLNIEHHDKGHSATAWQRVITCRHECINDAPKCAESNQRHRLGAGKLGECRCHG